MKEVMSVRLKQLIEAIPGAKGYGEIYVDITGITHDSRKVEPGFLFVAIKGYSRDGLEYVADAVDKGAVAVVSDREVKAPATVLVSDCRQALSRLAAAFYGYPAERMTVFGVTGTNGKTTTSHLLRSILRTAGRNTGLIGTLGVQIDDKYVSLAHTTPEAPDIHRLFSHMLTQGITDVVMEVSSHSLVLDRVSDVDFDVAVFTNITKDHLDFHKDINDYACAKARLFSLLAERDRHCAVINADADMHGIMIDATKAAVLTFGFENDRDVKGEIKQITDTHTVIKIQTNDATVDIKLALLGRFNAENALAAASAAIAVGIDASTIKKGLEQVTTIASRFERVSSPGQPTVIVDYAHSPDGLQKVLQTARECSQARVGVVFGCGGDRDKTKRPVMGNIAVSLADRAFITSDNPRTEQPRTIINDILTGIRSDADNYEVEPDRAQAIKNAVKWANEDDLVVIAGKGHEQYQIIGSKKLPFDDSLQARQALHDRAGGQRHA